MFIRVNFCWTKLESSSRSSGTGSSFEKILISAASRAAARDLPVGGGLIYPAISSKLGFHKFPWPGKRTFLDFRLIGLFLLQSFKKLCLFADTISDLVLVTHPVLNSHVIPI